MRLIFPLLLLIAAAASPAPKSAGELGYTMGVEFNAWAALREARVADPKRIGTVDVAEVKLWRAVKKDWKSFQQAQDLEYAGY